MNTFKSLILKNKKLFLFFTMDIFIIILLLIFNIFPKFAEVLYSKGIFRLNTMLMGKIFDIFPFSITEIIIITFPVLLIISMIFLFIKIIKTRKIKNYFIKIIKTILIIFSVIFIWFYLMWGFNYYRLSIYTKMNIDNDIKVTEEQFKKNLIKIIDYSNTLYKKEYDNYNYNYLNNIINKEIHNTIKKIDKVKIYPANRCKKSICGLLKKTNTAGVISPFILESHISNELFPAETPFVMAHEKSHLYGYAHETDANFLAFYTCINSNNNFIKYSGYVEILAYFLYDYKKSSSKDDYKIIYNKIRPEIQQLHKNQRMRYKRYDSKLNKFLFDIYDLYLKSNKVKTGKKSYNKVVDLIIKSEILNNNYY